MALGSRSISLRIKGFSALPSRPADRGAASPSQILPSSPRIRLYGNPGRLSSSTVAWGEPWAISSFVAVTSIFHTRYLPVSVTNSVLFAAERHVVREAQAPCNDACGLGRRITLQNASGRRLFNDVEKAGVDGVAANDATDGCKAGRCRDQRDLFHVWSLVPRNGFAADRVRRSSPLGWDILYYYIYKIQHLINVDPFRYFDSCSRLK